MLGLDLSFRFDRWYESLPPSPVDAGTVSVCVVRPPGGGRECPDSLDVSPEGGVGGDKWSHDANREQGGQVSLMNVHVVSSLAGGDRSRMAQSGDNLLVDLDLSEENLPVGTRLAIGSAELRVSAKPHRPCKFFAERFGADASKKVARANRRGRRGRGVLCEVLVAGTIRIDDEIRVTRP